MTFRVLTSFHYFRDSDMADLVDQLSTAYGGDVQLFADSGAFSAVTLGMTISLPDYRAWLHDWSSVITTATTLDVIGDPHATARNTEALEASGLTVLPTFHVGTPWPVLEGLCARYRYVALGGMVPHVRHHQELMRWLVRSFRTAVEHGTALHGFGLTAVSALMRLPFYSVDSSTWTTGARYGKLRVWDDVRQHMTEIRPGNPARVQRFAALLQEQGADPAVVARPSFALRTPGKSDAEYAAEYDMLRGSNGLAYHRLGHHLTRRHGVPPPPGRTTPGTCLYLASSDSKKFLPAARAAGTHDRRKVGGESDRPLQQRLLAPVAEVTR